MEQKTQFTEAEACRNSLLITLYGLEERIKNAKNAADYIDLIRRSGMLAEFMAQVLAKMSASGETLNPIDDKTVDWIKKM